MKALAPAAEVKVTVVRTGATPARAGPAAWAGTTSCVGGASL